MSDKYIAICPKCGVELQTLSTWSDFDHFCPKCQKKWRYWEITKRWKTE